MSHATMKTTILLLVLHTTVTSPAKNSASPVFEVINEQARVDDKKHLLYVNPLAGNSNAKLHAEHQQAMFNAERYRQHRAQIQRWMKVPQIDSYMKAYQESQENHQLALEQMQSNLNKRPTKTRQDKKTLQAKEVKEIQVPELTKITRADAVLTEKNRNHRSYGSVHFSPLKKRKINITPGPNYEQGVTIKPNGNIGLNNIEEQSKLYTEVVASKPRYVYPKLYSQMHGYRSAEDIQALNYLLSKPAQEQLTEFNALINQENEESLDKPMDIYFYLKDPSVLKSEGVHFAPYASNYVTDYKDEKPITEVVDDIEDPNQFTKPYVQGILTPINDVETTTMNNNYYKIEVEQTISGNKPKETEYTQYAVLQDKPTYEALTYEKPLAYYPTEESKKYIHHEQTGVQHLSQDGTGVSAYGDDDIHYAANYEFGYRVRDHKSGNDFGHIEQKAGDKTRGQYHVLLPDGRMQQVKYSAGPGGFHADISYDHLQ